MNPYAQCDDPIDLDRGIRLCRSEAEKLLDVFCHQAHWTQPLFQPSQAQFDHWVEALAMRFVTSLLADRVEGLSCGCRSVEHAQPNDALWAQISGLIRDLVGKEHTPLVGTLWVATAGLMYDLAGEPLDRAAKTRAFEIAVRRNLRASRQWFRGKLRAWRQRGKPFEDFYPTVSELWLPEFHVGA